MSDHASHSVSEWICNLKAGDSDAATSLWERYFESLVRLASQRLQDAPKRIADEDDVAVSVFASLCNGAERGRFSELSSREDLWRLLVAITKCKAVDHVRKECRQKRGGGLVRGESVFVGMDGDSPSDGIDQVVDDAPTPEFIAMLNEQHQHLLAQLNNDSLRDVALWRMEGYSNLEIAGKLGIGTKSVERKLKRIRSEWSRELSR